MEFQTAVADRVLHLALFVAAAVALIVVSLAVLERVLERAPSDGTRTIRPLHVITPIAATVAIGIAERLYHVFV
jgi:hypothetical protein